MLVVVAAVVVVLLWVSAELLVVLYGVSEEFESMELPVSSIAELVCAAPNVKIEPVQTYISSCKTVHSYSSNNPCGNLTSDKGLLQ